MTDGAFPRIKQDTKDESEDPFDDIWVLSLYIVLKLFEATNPVEMWKKAEYHRTANNMTGRPYIGGSHHERKTCTAGMVVTSTTKDHLEDVLGNKRKTTSENKESDDEAKSIKSRKTMGVESI